MAEILLGHPTSSWTNYYRYTDFTEFIFPVGLHNVHYDAADFANPYACPMRPMPAPEFKAVVDEEQNRMLSCVSKSYTLITNEWAYSMGVEIAEKIFKVKQDDIKFRDGVMPLNRASCFMNIKIDKLLEIQKVHNRWFAFVQVGNSYDKSLSLNFKVGFIMESMNGQQVPIGLLIPDFSLNLSVTHSWTKDTIKGKIYDQIETQYRNRNLFSEFEDMVERLLEITIVDDEILPLFCRLAKLKKLNEENFEDILLARTLLKIDEYSKKWIGECGNNAYAALCCYTQFISAHAFEMPNIATPTKFQSYLSAFFAELLAEKFRLGMMFSMDDFIGKTARERKNEIKLIAQ